MARVGLQATGRSPGWAPLTIFGLVTGPDVVILPPLRKAYMSHSITYLF